MSYQKRKDMLDKMMNEAMDTGVSYAFFEKEYDANLLLENLRIAIKKDNRDWKDYEIGRKKHQYQYSYGVYITKDKSLLPFTMQSYTYRQKENEYWVIRNLTQPEYHYITVLPKRMVNSYEWIKEKCEEALQCEVEIEIYENPEDCWYAKLRRLDNELQSIRTIQDTHE